MESRSLILTLYFAAIESNQPHLLGLPVVVPNSCPFVLNSFPKAPSNSVGNGPAPTLVQYDLNTPNTFEIFLGPNPNPVNAPPKIGLV